jgi:replication factor A1
VNVTLWGEEAEKCNGQHQPIILMKGTRITEFGGGKTLGTMSGTVMKVNFDTPDGHKLRGWFDNGGASNITVAVSAR